jgi:hypothetical protein
MEKILKNINTIKWLVIGIHSILFAFALVLGFVLADGAVVSTFSLSKTDHALSHALSLSGLLIIGNLVGIILLITPLYKTFIGNCVLVAYELALLIASIIFLSSEYSFFIGIIVCSLSYAAYIRKPS